MEDETAPNETQVVPSVEYCQVPLPVVPVMAIPLAAPVSTSPHEAEVRIVPTVVPLLVVSSSVPVSVTVVPLVRVGASLTEVTLIEAVAAWLEKALVPLPEPALA